MIANSNVCSRANSGGLDDANAFDLDSRKRIVPYFYFVDIGSIDAERSIENDHITYEPRDCANQVLWVDSE